MRIFGKTNRFWTTLFLAVAFFIYLFFGLSHLTKFETADERYWMYEDPENGRIHAYWEAIMKADWKGTYINDKPGVSLAYVSGSALLFKNNPAENLFSKKSFERSYNPQEIERVHFLFRLPLLIFNGLFCLLLFWLIWKFTENEWIALWSTIFMLLSPILLGISQIVNPDSLLWSFSAGAIFAFLAHLKSKEKKYLFFSALFLCFALLSKYSAIILIPFFLIIVLTEVLFAQAEGKNMSGGREASKLFGAYLSVIFGALFLFALLLPAVFVKPLSMFKTFIELDGFQYILIILVGALGLFFADMIFLKNKILSWMMEKMKFLTDIAPRLLALVFLLLFIFVLYHWASGTKYGEFIIRKVPFDMERGVAFREQAPFAQTILEFVPLLFSLTPLTLFAFLFILGRSIIKKTIYSQTVFLLLFFLAAFYSAMILQVLLVTIRYSIMLYPPVLVLASIGIWELFSWKRLKKNSKVSITLVILLISFWSLWTIKPFYFNYTNDLLPQSRVITDAWGYGGFEAAEFLNSLPNAQNLLVWTDYNGYCPFLKGKCIMGKSDEKFKFKNDDVIPDYFIKTRRGTIMYHEMWDVINSKFLYKNNKPVWEMDINGRSKNFVEIYKYVSEKNEEE